MSGATICETSLVVFQAAGRQLAVDVDQVVELLQLVAYAIEGQSDSVVEGTVNYRGRGIPAIDLEGMLTAQGRSQAHVSDHLVVLQHEESQFAIRVRDVSELILIAEDRIQNADPMSARNSIVKRHAHVDHLLLGVVSAADILGAVATDSADTMKPDNQ